MRGIAMIAAGLAGASVAPAAPAGGQEEPVAEHHGRPANRLARETSPYLLQHAHNPVDWFAWGEEAFDEARRRNVPIFLSIGYSTCYWCHVMERESFEDEATGRLMSELFVCIKVDREERPDVDDIYMTATTAMTGRGGWPMSVFLTPPGASGENDPGLKPFWCGTYFPPEPRHGMPAFTQVLRALSQAWKDQRGEIVEQAEALAGHLREALEAADGAAMRPAPIGAETVNQAAAGLLRMFDRTHGGFGGAPGQPKFPQPVFLEFLLDVLPSAGDEDTRTAIETAIGVTLDRMAMGGMHDQVGGGFHRYSVDEKWLVPHFEKMLYDNAQLLRVYARAAARTGDAFHRGVAAEIVAYIRREMTTLGPDGGGFYSAQDAEVDGREGLNYLWTPTEVDAVFAGRPGGAEDAAFAKRVFGLDDGPNFRDPHHPQEPASNVLFLAARPDVAAETPLARGRAAMLAARDARTQPRLDDKVIASWNGLMIGALADAGRLLGEAAWVAMAERAAAFAWERLRDDGGALMRTWRAGRAKTPAMLEDYAALIAGFAAVHRARGESAWLARAEELTREARGLFCEPATGAWYDTRSGQRDLIVRGRSMHDGAVASAQSMMLHALLDLHEATGEAGWKTDAERLMASMSRGIAENPVGAINATRALLRGARPDGSLLGAVADAPVGVHEALAPGDVGDAPEAIATPVGVFAATDRVSVRRGAPATLPIELRIDEGWHITAHEPFAPDAKPEDRVAGLVGLTVGMVGGEGLRARVEYPRGERLDGADGLPPLLVHTGSARLDIVIERTGAALSGAPILLVTYQACDDRACLEPVTVELDVAVDAE